MTAAHRQRACSLGDIDGGNEIGMVLEATGFATPDQRIMSPLLSPLSYGPNKNAHVSQYEVLRNEGMNG